MPVGGKSNCTDKQSRPAQHIEGAYQCRALAQKAAVRRACAAVDKISEWSKTFGVRSKPPNNASHKMAKGKSL